MTTPLPWSNATYARNDCQQCRKRDADFEVTVREPMKKSRLLFRDCLGPWGVEEMWVTDECVVVTLD